MVMTVIAKFQAAKAISGYVHENALRYADIVKNDGPMQAVATLKEDMTLDGYGSIIEDVAENFYSILTIIILVTLIPAVSYLIISGLNITLPDTWAGGLTPETLWISASAILGIVVTVALIVPIFKAIQSLRNKRNR